MDPLISILILNYNGKKFLYDCLSSVILQTYTNFEIIFFDNASSDDSINYVKNTFNDHRIKIYHSEKNLGFADGNNKAYEKAKGKFIVLLNNDTIVEKNWLEELYKCLISDSKIGAVQSLVLTEGIPDIYYKMNGTINLLGHNIMQVFPIDKNGIGEIFQLNGCSLIISRKVIEHIGGLFPAIYFAYSEDSYLSFNLSFAGYKLIHNASSVVHHKGNATMKKYKSKFITFYQERNRILNFLIFFSRGFIIKYIPLLLFNIKLKILYSIFTKKYSFIGIIRAYWWILFNVSVIKHESSKIKNIKGISEKEILKLLSCKIANGDNPIEKFLNFISKIYCRFFRIKTIEIE